MCIGMYVRLLDQWQVTANTHTAVSLTQFMVDNMPTLELLQAFPRNPTHGQYISVEA